MAWTIVVALSIEIWALAKHGKRVRGIARNVGVSRKTVRRDLRDTEAPRYKERPSGPAKIDPFKSYPCEPLAAAAPDVILATVLFDEIRQRAYDGGYTMVQACVATLKPAPKPDPVMRFEMTPASSLLSGPGADQTRTEPPVGICRDARLERDAPRRFRDGRAGGDADRLP
ncbi:MAG: hypothetical protein AAGF45_10310 [Pseudomonadota bacterium]